jgi:fatty-acyl-CoA synthase
MPAPSAATAPIYSDVIVEALQRFGSREAFVLGDQRITYSETAAIVSQMQQVLHSFGIGLGGGVAALSPNAPEVWMCQAATYLLGGHYSGLHPLGSVDDHVFLLDDAEISVLIVHPKFEEVGAAILQRSTSLKVVLTFGQSDLGQNILDLCQKFAPRRLQAGPAQPDDLAWLQYTGGTTGRPKGVMLPQRAMAQEVQSGASWGVPLTPRFLAAAPITHAGVLPLVPTLVRGGTVVLQQGFDPERYLDAIQRERINYGFLVPTMLYALLDNADPGRYDLSSLETLVYGAAPTSPTRIAEALDLLGPVLLQAFGQTECIGMATYLARDEHDPKNHPELLSSCGRPVQGVSVELLDDCRRRSKMRP